MNRALVPAGAGGLAEDPHVLLERRNKVREDLDGHDNLRPDWRANDMVRLGLLDVAFRERQDLAEGEREVERSMRDGAEVGVGPARLVLVVGNDREVDLLALIHRFSP